MKIARHPVTMIAPIAAILSGCTFRPWTPSVSVAFWAEDVPPARDTGVPHTSTVLARWMLPPNDPWAPYGKVTLISSLDSMYPHAELPDVRTLDSVKAAEEAAARVADAGLPENTLWVVDLRGAASVAFGATMTDRAREPLSPVLTFNNWPAEDELVPAEETLAGIVSFAPSPNLTRDRSGAGVPIFLLDSWRLAYRFDEPYDGTYDNRYMLMPHDFPPPETLRAQGITRVLYVVDDLDDSALEEDDLHETFLAYQAAGITLHMVDLDWLIKTPQNARWDERLADARLFVEPRRTLVDDPAFYIRAAGGFGGIYGRPHVGVGFHGGGGYGGGG